MQLHHPALHGPERRKHPYSLPAFYSHSSLSERNRIRRKSFSLPSGAGQCIDYPIECSSRKLWRCCHCRNVHCNPYLYVHQFLCHRFRTGISAGMRIQLRSRIKPPCPTGILVLCESRRYLLSHLLPHRLHLCPGSSFLVPKRRPASYRRRSRRPRLSCGPCRAWRSIWSSGCRRSGRCCRRGS